MVYLTIDELEFDHLIPGVMLGAINRPDPTAMPRYLRDRVDVPHTREGFLEPSTCILEVVGFLDPTNTLEVVDEHPAEVAGGKGVVDAVGKQHQPNGG